MFNALLNNLVVTCAILCIILSINQMYYWNEKICNSSNSWASALFAPHYAVFYASEKPLHLRLSLKDDNVSIGCSVGCRVFSRGFWSICQIREPINLGYIPFYMATVFWCLGFFEVARACRLVLKIQGQTYLQNKFALEKILAVWQISNDGPLV